MADRRLGVDGERRYGSVQEKMKLRWRESKVDVTTEMCGPRLPVRGAKRTGSVHAALNASA